MRSRPSFNGISGRLLAAFGAALAAMLLMAGLGLWQLRALSNQVGLMVTQSAPRFETVNGLDSLVHVLSQRAAMAFVLDDKAEVARELAGIESDKARIGELLETLDRQMSGTGEAAAKLQEQIQSDNGALLVAMTKFGRALAADRRELARKTLFEEVIPRRDAMASTLGTYHSFELKRFASLHDEVERGYETSLKRIAAITLLTLGAVLLLAWRIARGITVPLGQAVDLASAIATGRLDNRIEAGGCDETIRLLEALRIMQDNLVKRTDADHAALERTTRIRQALDSADTGVLVTDAAGEIIHLNATLVECLARVEADLRKDLPHLQVGDLVGLHYETLHREPARWRAAVEGLCAPLRERMTLGSRHFDVVASPIIDGAGQRIGSVFGWNDVTEQVGVEGEIAAILRVAVEGDFSKRIELAGKRDFLRDLSRAVNRLLEASEGKFSELGCVLKALAEGDLTARIEGNYGGKFGDVANDSNRTVARLTAIVREIREASEAICTGSGEMAQGNGDLSRRTTEQALSLQATAASMEELTGTVRQNAENAKQANQLAVSASGVATRGGQVVSQVVETMGAISASAKKIADIIAVIDDIAFQTNILALNAAVEAARAGDQGRGFAVVATEVRSLAQRSAEAAREIKSLIGDSVDKVGAGTKLVADAGRTMEEVVNSVQRVADIISGITVASQEQSAGIEQVNEAITQMDHVTQQNAVLVEQAAAAAESMREHALGLSAAVSVFRVDAGETLAAPAAVTSLFGRKGMKPATNPAPRPAVKLLPPTRTPRPAVGRDGDWKEF